ncbi:MAG: hypothetical protein A3E82_09560 [Gammaproteobacteria bacterium RIFCSPHIGHO2_12_FULL_38_11]|nr:MAG: hypothetical protein A3E82_09560 [Gammaproteobacteria bacterium RIFCSPHIGHO2_12_FULL_38_11]
MINDFFKQYTPLFDALSLRERLAVTITIALVSFFIWYALFERPLGHYLQSLSVKMSIVKNNVQRLALNLLHYQDVLNSPTDILENQIKLLKAQLAQKQQQLSLFKRIIYTREDLQDFLQAVSQTGSMLSMDHINSDAVMPIMPSAVPNLLSQQITFQFHGRYFDSLYYLDYLEKLPWYISFDSVKYQVEQYPNAKVTVVLNVLSAAEGALHE